MKNGCICGNDLDYELCCARFIDKGEQPDTVEELMRSRYSAYVQKNGQYIYDTCSRRLQNIEDIENINSHAIEWIGLSVEDCTQNEVVFTAFYKEDGVIKAMKEHSFFILEDKRLRYDRGEVKEAKIERNDPCPCQSGKKYKKCCG